jgi:hypothetical protein
MFHRYHDISFFVALFNIPMSFCNLFQRPAPVDDRLYCSRLQEIFE